MQINSDFPDKYLVKAESCHTDDYYGLATRIHTDKVTVFILIRFNRKWCWVSPGSDMNYCQGHSDFDEILRRALLDEKNAVVRFDSQSDLFSFCLNPTMFYKALEQ